MSNLRYWLLKVSFKDIFQNDWISDSRVNEHRSVQSIVILQWYSDSDILFDLHL